MTNRILSPIYFSGFFPPSIGPLRKDRWFHSFLDLLPPTSFRCLPWRRPHWSVRIGEAVCCPMVGRRHEFPTYPCLQSSVAYPWWDIPLVGHTPGGRNWVRAGEKSITGGHPELHSAWPPSEKGADGGPCSASKGPTKTLPQTPASDNLTPRTSAVTSQQ